MKKSTPCPRGFPSGGTQVRPALTAPSPRRWAGARAWAPALGLTWALLTAAGQAAAQNAAPPSGTIAQGQGQGQTPPPEPSPPDASDPVSRFLSERGLLSTRPVSELAQQVRDRATDVASELVLSAMDFLGVRYQRGGTDRDSGFDCSGFTRHVFENSVGLILPRRAAEQAAMPGMLPVNTADLKPGDLVFFNTLRHTFSHVGIYVGDNKFIHSPRAGGSVRIEDMRTAYWRQRFDGARRPPAVATLPPSP